jgi:EAL domain-containing protein (putative c-di-GMP-specific phosphodiesterase class I)
LTEAVAEMRAMGLAIAMDDFGIARSNFDRVAALRPDFVKLDRSILVDAVGDSAARRMLPTVIGILRETGAKVVMEGVEDAAEALLSIESGADFLQGFCLATPSAKLHDGALSERMLHELVRMCGPQRVCPVEAVQFPAPAGSLSRLLGSALRDAPPRETPVTEQAR